MYLHYHQIWKADTCIFWHTHTQKKNRPLKFILYIQARRKYTTLLQHDAWSPFYFPQIAVYLIIIIIFFFYWSNVFVINHVLNFQYPAMHLKVRYMLFKTFTCTNHPSTCYAGKFFKEFSWSRQLMHHSLCTCICNLQECQHSTRYCHGLCRSSLQNSLRVYVEISPPHMSLWTSWSSLLGMAEV